MSRRDNRAIVERRHTGAVDSDDALTALYRRLEFYPTPPWTGRAIGRFIQRLDPSARTVWEPACGQGHMAAALAETFEVKASDVHDYGYGQVRDFLAPTEPEMRGEDPRLCDWIITNPPFRLAETFAQLGLKRARRGVALLCRLAFEQGGERYPQLMRLSAQATPCERPSMRLGRWDPELSTATPYSLFVWMTPEAEAQSPYGGVMAACRAAGGWWSTLIAPGTRDRLHKAEDVARFAGGVA